MPLNKETKPNQTHIHIIVTNFQLEISLFSKMIVTIKLRKQTSHYNV